MNVVTFYSYKGGVGRTLTATNFAVYLAKLGLKVVLIDFDLDAPGVDSKFPAYVLPEGQKGMIDIILAFQRTGEDTTSLQEISCNVPLTSPRQEYTLCLLPAGDYLAADYAAKLNELDWTKIFSSERNGVAFFQSFMSIVDKELAPDVVVIDSRTGFSEIGGLCTQQLADETVMLTSLARESVKMTKHLASVIKDSAVAKELGKAITTKVVVSRIPRPENPTAFKEQYCREFGVPESSLFLLYSCPALEREEFVAMLSTDRDDELVTGYMQLFQGLNVGVAEQSILEEIGKTESGLLSCPPAEAESRIREMVALYPHPEVYRCAMRFFNLTQQAVEAFKFGLKLLDLKAKDQEGEALVASFFLRESWSPRYGFARRRQRDLEIDVDRLTTIAGRVYDRGELTTLEKVGLSNIAMRAEQVAKAYDIAMDCYEHMEEIDNDDVRVNVIEVAARAAYALGKMDAATELIASIPFSEIGAGLAGLAIELKAAAGDKEEAFALAKRVVESDIRDTNLGPAIALAKEMDRCKELEVSLRNSGDLEYLKENRKLLRELDRNGFGDFVRDLRRRGPSGVARARRTPREE